MVCNLVDPMQKQAVYRIFKGVENTPVGNEAGELQVPTHRCTYIQTQGPPCLLPSKPFYGSEYGQLPL